MGPQVLGGPCITALFKIITKCHGMNSAQRSASTTFLQESCTASYRNSWIYNKAPIVCEYIKKFNYLAQYDTHHVDTDDKKAELFRKGLSLPLHDCLVQFCDMSFNTLVSVAIEQEGTYRALLAEEEKKRKRVLSGTSEDSIRGAPLKYRLFYTPPASKS
jgi:hypothetical protein